MSAIDDIRKQVVQHLLEQHHQAKERGEEFYFTVEITDPYAVPYFLQDELKSKATLKVLFYGNRERQEIAYLIIADTSQVFLIITLDASNRYDELKEAADQLKQYAMNYLNRIGTRGIHSQFSPGQVQSIVEFIQPADILGKVDSFINGIKPEVDACTQAIKNKLQYSYMFLSKTQFDDYLQAEPAYTPPASITKTTLRLASVRAINYKGINSLRIDNIPASTRWIVLTGENGYGKTSVLQTIAAGLYGNYDESGKPLVSDNSFIGISYYANGQLVETDSKAPRQISADKKLSRELATYGSSRLQISASVTREMIDRQLPTTYHLFNSDGILLSVEQLLKDSFGKPFFKQLEKLFTSLIPQLARIDIKEGPQSSEVLYVEQDDAENLLTKGLPFSQLAAGFRNVIAMIGDMVYRLSTKQNVQNLRDLQGIIMIDEIELHLHPTYQKLLPEILTEQFPNLQFIVSTHSPIPLLGIPKDVGVVLLHVSRSEETGIVVEQLDVDFSVLTPNAILSSPIFGFKELIPDSKPNDRMIQPQDTYKEVEADRQLRQGINKFLSPERQKELLDLITKH